MFAANPDFQVWPNRTAINDSLLHQFSHTLTVQLLEWIAWQDAFLDVAHQETALSVVPAITVSHLGEVVCSEGEELRHGGDFTCGHSSPWDFNHRTEFIGYLYALFLHHLFSNALENRLNSLKLIDVTS